MINLLHSKMNQFTYREWNTCFANNNEHRLMVDCSMEADLPEEKQKLIFPSIQAFQKGEGSDGRYLMETVDGFVQKTGENDYKDAMLWFVKEENWHSAYLRKYMEHYQIPVIEKSFLDKVFRKLRQVGGLKCEVTVLVTAEMIALTYYDALGKSTDSAVLKSICNQMLHDELPHIMFQSYTLSHFRNCWLDEMARVLLMEVTSLFVWMAFRDVYRAGGYDFGTYFRENLGYLRQSVLLAKRCMDINFK